jgi:hypothetical protein
MSWVTKFLVTAEIYTRIRTYTPVIIFAFAKLDAVRWCHKKEVSYFFFLNPFRFKKTSKIEKVYMNFIHARHNQSCILVLYF